MIVTNQGVEGKARCKQALHNWTADAENNRSASAIWISAYCLLYLNNTL